MLVNTTHEVERLRALVAAQAAERQALLAVIERIRDYRGVTSAGTATGVRGIARHALSVYRGVS